MTLPTDVTLKYENCNQEVEPEKLYDRAGNCPYCGQASSWTILTHYTEVDETIPIESIATALAIGVQWSEETEYTNVLGTPNVHPGVVSKLIDGDPREMPQRDSSLCKGRC